MRAFEPSLQSQSFPLTPFLQESFAPAAFDMGVAYLCTVLLYHVGSLRLSETSDGGRIAELSAYLFLIAHQVLFTASSDLTYLLCVLLGFYALYKGSERGAER